MTVTNGIQAAQNPLLVSQRKRLLQSTQAEIEHEHISNNEYLQSSPGKHPCRRADESPKKIYIYKKKIK